MMDQSRCLTILILSFLGNVNGEKCGSSILSPSLTWNKGQKGELRFLVPDATEKWKVEITFDSPVNSITAWQGTKEKCVPNKKRCVFENQSWNGKKAMGDSMELGHQINFDAASFPPKMSKLLFKYCDSTACNKWEKIVVCQGIQLQDTLITTTDATISSTIQPTESPTSGIPGNILINGNFENRGSVEWECNGCVGNIVNPGCDSVRSYLVEQRKASWSGPRQQISIAMLSPQNDRYKFGYSILSNSSLDIKWKLRVTFSPNDVKYYTLSTLSILEQNVEIWNEQESITTILSDETLKAQEIAIYLEAVPASANYRIDNVYLIPDDEPKDWKEEANQQIEKLRKSDAEIAIKGIKSFKDADNLQLLVSQTSHNFAFGTAVDCQRISDCFESGYDDEYCSFAKMNYNMLVCGYRMKIKYVEMKKDEHNYKAGDNTVAWAEMNNMKVRGHSLLWAKAENNPSWYRNLYGEEFVNAVYDRIDSAVSRYDGKIPQWDVINEMIDQGYENHTFYLDHSGDSNIRTKIFQRSKALSPATMLFLNDYGVVDDRSGRFELYQKQIRELLESGTPIDGIGLQSHFKGENITVSAVRNRVDQLWKEFGIPLWVTEFTWSTGGKIEDPGHEIHAEQLENYYRLMFGHEGVGGILMWNFDNKVCCGTESNIVDSVSLEPNVAGDTYLKLYHEEWRTEKTLKKEVTGSGNENAIFKFRGFKGDYDITLMEGENMIKTWKKNLVDDSNWTLLID